MQLKQNELVGNGRDGLWLARKCDSSGEWFDVGPFRFSRSAAMADLVAARGKRRTSVEWFDGEKLT